TAAAQALGGRSALAAGALADASGNLLIDLRVTGTAKAPRVSWDPSAMRDRLLGRASQAMVQQQQRLEDELRQAARAREAAAADSAKRAIDRVRLSVQDSLRRRAGDVFKNFFGAGARDSTHP